MIRKFILLLLCSFLFSNCDDGFIPIYEECYWTNDLLVLHKFLINSQLNKELKYYASVNKDLKLTNIVEL